MRKRLESRSPRHMVVREIFQDNRGSFMETFRGDQFRGLKLPSEFAQSNESSLR